MIKSIVEERRSINDVKNSILIKYNEDLTDDYFKNDVICIDQDSVAKFGLQETEINFNLINDEDIISYVWEILKSIKSKPFAITTFTFFLSAYQLEKMDVIMVETLFNNYINYVGEIITIQRDFGLGKNNKINTFKVTCKRVANIINEINLLESITIDDENQFYQGNYQNYIENINEAIEIIDIDYNAIKGKTVQLSEQIINDDSDLVSEKLLTGYGVVGYGESTYGN